MNLIKNTIRYLFRQLCERRIFYRIFSEEYMFVVYKIHHPMFKYLYDPTTAFRVACSEGNISEAKNLKRLWPTIQHRTHNNYSFTSACTDDKNMPTARWLLDTCPDINFEPIMIRLFYMLVLGVDRAIQLEWPIG